MHNVFSDCVMSHLSHTFQQTFIKCDILYKIDLQNVPWKRADCSMFIRTFGFVNLDSCTDGKLIAKHISKFIKKSIVLKGVGGRR